MLNKQKIFALYTIIILIFSIGAFAQEAAPTVDPGLTPDSALYGVELFAEDVQLLFTFNPVSKVELAASFVEERHTEMDVMLQQENYDGLAEVAGVMQEDLVVLQEAADDIPATEENLEVINSIEKTAIIEGNHVDEVHTELIARVETGAVTEEVVESIELSAVEKATTDVQVSSEETKNEVVDVISAEKGISSIEAEVIVEKSNEESGLTELQEVEVKEEIVKTEDKIEQLELEISRSVDAGYDIAEAKALSHVIEESKTRLQISIDNYENGLIGNSFLELVNTEQLILNTEAFVDDPEEINIVELDEAVIKDQQEREEDSKKYVEEYDIYKDELSDKYPDKAEEFEHVYETQKQVVEITDKLDEVYEREVAKLQDEGKTEDEAASIIAQRFAEEYRIAYGEEYLPPIISEEEGLPTEGIDAGSVFHSEEDLRLIGGVIEDYNYIDPNSGFEYQFNSKGYEYTTPLGFTYSKDFADNVEVLESYQKGDEVYTHTESTTEGTVDYNYFTTGYEVVMPDGTTETFAYPTGEHDFVGGGEVSIEATGFEITTESGETSTYDYNPKFDTYVSQEGTVLAPPEGASIHNSEVDYSSETNSYVFRESGESWTYDPGTNSWLSSTGESYKPDTSAVAPVGHEYSQLYTTEDGTGWSYDSSSGKWTSSSGETYSESTGEYMTATHDSWTYDPGMNTWTSASGETHTGGEVTSGGLVSSADSFTFDPATGTWTSSSGQTYSGGGFVGGEQSPGSESGVQHEMTPEEKQMMEQYQYTPPPPP